MVSPKVAPARPGSKASPPSSGVLQASEYLISVVGAVLERSVNGKELNTETANRAQHELERIEQQIEQLEAAAGDNRDARRQLESLHEQVHALRRQMDAHLNAWRKAELARHPQRPYTLDYVERIFTDWSEIHGDRAFGDDPAIVCGMARFQREEVVVLGHQKGRDTKQKLHRNFGMPNPEGYRKALRVMRTAEKFGRPIFTFVDTPGAYPGLGAEERGQAEAIAHNLREIARIGVPIITTITGEGGSGGALAIAVADRVLMMENSTYAVISPEGCASIMWRDASKKELAAQAMRITAADLQQLGCVDEIVPEPDGGAHTDHERAAELLSHALQKNFVELKQQPANALLASRYEKFRLMAQFFTGE